MIYVFEVRCPYCKAGPHKPCVTAGGRTLSGAHRKRWAEAEGTVQRAQLRAEQAVERALGTLRVVRET